jgi:hypothetical protein
MKMYVDDVRLELQMEIEQRYLASYLHHRGMKLLAIVAERAVVHHEDTFEENRVKCWLREIRLHCSDSLYPQLFLSEYALKMGYFIVL